MKYYLRNVVTRPPKYVIFLLNKSYRRIAPLFQGCARRSTPCAQFARAFTSTVEDFKDGARFSRSEQFFGPQAEIIYS
jgi:hypothetical protein